jgi:predicted transcriptional regulator
MSKAVLLSIQPKWSELIASGKKTIEVRKTRPKLETPFKVYIYCTKGKFEPSEHLRNNLHYDDSTIKVCEGQGKVIGEFVCDAIFPMSVWYSNPNDRLSRREYPYTCLTDKEIMDYLGNGVEGYGWHISNLVIYDKPKDLSEFFAACNKPTGTDCSKCVEQFNNSCKQLVRPPQSWRYVEEDLNECDS